MRKFYVAITAAAALWLISSPPAIADDPLTVITFTAVPVTIDLPVGAAGQVDFSVETGGTNPATDLTVSLGLISGPLNQVDATHWSGSLNLPVGFRAGAFTATVSATDGTTSTSLTTPVNVRTEPVLALALTPSTPKAGGNYLVTGSILQSNGSGAAPVAMPAALTLTGPGYASTFLAPAGVFHHAASRAMPGTWTLTYAGDATHLATSTARPYGVSANATRIVSFDAGPEPAYRGGAIGVRGYLQRYSPTLARWIGYGGQRVAITRTSPSGYATTRTTTSTGYFAGLIRGANVVQSAVWHASFAGWSSGGTVVNGPSVGGGDAVAAVTAPLRITRVYYDSPGSDRPTTNAKLNAEYVRITNAGSRTANLYRWWITDPAGHYYIFGGNIYLSPGQSLYLHTGTGVSGGSHYYWGQGNYVWNNTGDRAYLRSDLNYTVDSCAWGAGIGYTNC